jgi:LCP family protein required for cell wall assembly
MADAGRRAAGLASGASRPSQAKRSRARRAGEQPVVGKMGLGGALAWTTLGTIIPGLGLLRAPTWPRRIAGIFALTVLVGALVVVAYAALHWQTVFALIANVKALRLAALGLVAVAGLMVALICFTYWSLAPRYMKAGKRLIAGVVVAVLSAGVAGPALVGAQYAVSSASALETIFTEEPSSATVPTFDPENTTDPWAGRDRINVLFLGYDRGIGRTEADGGLTDAIMTASIDIATGNTVLISLPRETAQMPFPADSPLHDYFPYGWYDGYNPRNSGYYLNAMYLLLPWIVPEDVLGPTQDLGADALKLSVGEALGLTIDYYVLVNIDGATALIDAIGGIYVNINTEVPKEPIELGYFEIGENVWLSGEDALQYARARHWDSDFHRTARQRCVMKAILDQADLATLLTRYESIAAASSDMIRTDVPANMIPALFQLMLKVKNQGVITGMGFVDGEYGFSQEYPNFPQMRQRVAEAIAATTAATPTTPTTDPTTGETVEPTPSAEDTSLEYTGSLSDAQNLDDFCAFHPESG